MKDIRGVWKTVDYKIKSTVFGVLGPLTTELLLCKPRQVLSALAFGILMCKITEKKNDQVSLS